MRVRVLPYKQGSRSARALADALGGKVLLVRNSRFVPRGDDFLINWGASAAPEALRNHGLHNDPATVSSASNKLRFFQSVHDVTPNYWTDKQEIPDDAFPIVCRTVLNGHSGEGIVIANTRDELVSAPLYVQYMQKKHEFRVHVGAGGEIIAVQRKARRREVPDSDVNWMVRNHANGFVFVRNGFVAPEQVIGHAVSAVEQLELDFGAVDVIYNEAHDKAYVLEVNTAPGLEGQTVTDYVNYFQGRMNNESE